MNQPSGDLNSLIFRARELKQLGNSDAEIRAVLLRSGAQPNEIETILAQIRPAGKKSGSNCLLFLAIGMVIAVIAGGVLAALFLFKPAAEEPSSIADSLKPITIFSELEIPTAEVFAKPPTAAVSLSPDAEAYFSAIWNLEGTSMEKSAQMARAMPPVELMAAHAEMAMSYAIFANADQNLKTMEVMIEMECEGDTGNYCKDLYFDKAKIEIDRDKAYSEMYDRWLRTCETWRDYYERVGVSFPYVEGRCKYP